MQITFIPKGIQNILLFDDIFIFVVFAYSIIFFFVNYFYSIFKVWSKIHQFEAICKANTLFIIYDHNSLIERRHNNNECIKLPIILLFSRRFMYFFFHIFSYSFTNDSHSLNTSIITSITWITQYYSETSLIYYK